MDQIAATSILFDIYGGLLTEKKREVMVLYHEENLSLSEIAEEQGVSRAAVHDALKSAEKNLRDYEHKLGLAAAYMRRQDAVQELREIIADRLGEVPVAAPAGSAEGEGNKTGILEKIDKLLSELED